MKRPCEPVCPNGAIILPMFDTMSLLLCKCFLAVFGRLNKVFEIFGRGCVQEQKRYLYRYVDI